MSINNICFHIEIRKMLTGHTHTHTHREERERGPGHPNEKDKDAESGRGGYSPYSLLSAQVTSRYLCLAHLI